jgi:hypothetical protein
LRRELPRRPRQVRRTPAGAPIEQQTPVNPVTRAKSAPREEYCLALLQKFPQLGEIGRGLPYELFTLSENRELYRRWAENVSVTEEEGPLWEHYQHVLATRVLALETVQAEAALLDCISRLEQVRMRAIKEASALALAEGEAGVRPGQVASIARAKLVAGESEEAPEDQEAEAIASRLLEDMQAGLSFHRRLIEGNRTEQARPTHNAREQGG